MATKKWIRVRLPRDMHDYVKILIYREQVKKKYHFHSIADFVRIAVQDKIREVEATTKD